MDSDKVTQNIQCDACASIHVGGYANINQAACVLACGAECLLLRVTMTNKCSSDYSGMSVVNVSYLLRDNCAVLVI